VNLRYDPHLNRMRSCVRGRRMVAPDGTPGRRRLGR